MSSFWKGAYVVSAVGGLLVMVIAAPRAWGVGDGGAGPVVREAAAGGGRARYGYVGFYGGK